MNGYGKYRVGTIEIIYSFGDATPKHVGTFDAHDKLFSLTKTWLVIKYT